MGTILTKVLAIALVSILMIVMVAPQPAYAQGGLLSDITGIRNVLRMFCTADEAVLIA